MGLRGGSVWGGVHMGHVFKVGGHMGLGRGLVPCTTSVERGVGGVIRWSLSIAQVHVRCVGGQSAGWWEYHSRLRGSVDAAAVGGARGERRGGVHPSRAAFTLGMMARLQYTASMCMVVLRGGWGLRRVGE